MSGSTTSTQRFGPGERVKPGTDCFATESGEFRFGVENSIPAGFFEPGSDPFAGVVRLGGRLLGDPLLGDTDTVVRRPSEALLPHEGTSVDVPIELVALSLVSVAPITVTGPSGDSQWDVSVMLSPLPPPPGSMTIIRGTSSGGTFDATFPVTPRFTFTEVGNPGNVRVLDYSDLYGPIMLDPIVPWDYFVAPGDGPMPQASADNEFYAQTGILYTSLEFDLSLRNAAETAAIPEPATAVLVALGLLAVLRRRRQRQGQPLWLPPGGRQGHPYKCVTPRTLATRRDPGPALGWGPRATS